MARMVSVLVLEWRAYSQLSNADSTIVASMLVNYLPSDRLRRKDCGMPYRASEDEWHRAQRLKVPRVNRTEHTKLSVVVHQAEVELLATKEASASLSPDYLQWRQGSSYLESHRIHSST